MAPLTLDSSIASAAPLPCCPFPAVRTATAAAGAAASASPSPSPSPSSSGWRPRLPSGVVAVAAEAPVVAAEAGCFFDVVPCCFCSFSFCFRGAAAAAAVGGALEAEARGGGAGCFCCFLGLGGGDGSSKSKMPQSEALKPRSMVLWICGFCNLCVGDLCVRVISLRSVADAQPPALAHYYRTASGDSSDRTQPHRDVSVRHAPKAKPNPAVRLTRLSTSRPQTHQEHRRPAEIQASSLETKPVVGFGC